MSLESLSRHTGTMRTRFAASIGIFLLFVLGAAACIAMGINPLDPTRDVAFMLLMMPFIGSLLVMPRSTAPNRWPKPESAEEGDAIELMREELRSIQLRSTFVRVGYIVSLIVLLGLAVVAR